MLQTWSGIELTSMRNLDHVCKLCFATICSATGFHGGDITDHHMMYGTKVQLLRKKHIAQGSTECQPTDRSINAGHSTGQITKWSYIDLQSLKTFSNTVKLIW